MENNMVPGGLTVTYGIIVVDFWMQKDDKNTMRLTVGGYHID